MKKTMLRKLAIFLAVLLLAAALSACGGGAGATGGDTVRVGSKDFTENLILGELYALVLEGQGLTVERNLDIAGAVAHTAITSGEIDLYPEYTGTGLITVLKHEPVTDPDEVYAIVKEAYDEQFDLVWLDQTAANDGQGIVVSTQVAEQYGIKTLSDLQANATELRFASQGEFDLREDGLPALEQVYGPFDFKSIQTFSNALKYEVLENGEADAAPAYTTEGRLVQPQFTLLEDDKAAWPPYRLAPVVRRDWHDAHPEAVAALNALGKTLDTATVTGLNAQVDVDKLEYEDVALAYYESVKDSLQA